MFRRIFLSAVDSMVGRIARRMEYMRIKELQNGAVCATLSPTAVLFPESQINNFVNNPRAIMIGANSHVRGELQIFWNGGRIEIGEWVFVGPGSRIWSQSSVTIGNNVMISHLVDVHDTGSHPLNWQERQFDTQAILSGKGYRTPTETVSAPVVIEDNAWLGFKSSVMKGVRVGRGAIVAAGSMVTKDVPAWTIVGGNPAAVIRPLTDEERADRLAGRPIPAL